MPVETHHITEDDVAGEVGSFTYNVTMTLGAGALARSARGWLTNYSSRYANRCSYCSSAWACCRSFECARILSNCRTADRPDGRALVEMGAPSGLPSSRSCWSYTPTSRRMGLMASCG